MDATENFKLLCSVLKFNGLLSISNPNNSDCYQDTLLLGL